LPIKSKYKKWDITWMEFKLCTNKNCIHLKYSYQLN
jgi:hypothetical protein